MNKWIPLFLVLILYCSSLANVFALEEMQYQQKKLPDGSTEMTYSESNGTSIRQVQRSDGTIITHSIDKKGTETVTTQYPDGKTDIKKNLD